MTDDHQILDAHQSTVAALNRFLDTQKGSLRNVKQWAEAAGMPDSTLRSVLSGKTKDVGAITLAKLAEGASRLMGRKVTISQLLGEEPILPLDIQLIAGILNRLDPLQQEMEIAAIKHRLERLYSGLDSAPEE